MQLSKRMLAVASLAGESGCLADIGTDHGYVPIYLMQQKKISHGIACDVNRGPLQRAKENIAAYQMEEHIETRLSDGLASLEPGEADTLVIAGMGGALIIRILEEGRDVLCQVEKMVLQPQSEILLVRKFLYEHGYYIADEDMIFEDGKYYPMMLVKHGNELPLTDLEYRYGPILLKKKHTVLKAFLNKEEAAIEKIKAALMIQSGERVEKRLQETENEWNLIQKAKELI